MSTVMPGNVSLSGNAGATTPAMPAGRMRSGPYRFAAIAAGFAIALTILSLGVHRSLRERRRVAIRAMGGRYCAARPLALAARLLRSGRTQAAAFLLAWWHRRETHRGRVDEARARMASAGRRRCRRHLDNGLGRRRSRRCRRMARLPFSCSASMASPPRDRRPHRHGDDVLPDGDVAPNPSATRRREIREFHRFNITRDHCWSHSRPRILVKGPVIVVLIALAAFLYLAMGRVNPLRVAARRWPWIMLALAIGVAATWYVPASSRGVPTRGAASLSIENFGHFLPAKWAGRAKRRDPSITL